MHPKPVLKNGLFTFFSMQEREHVVSRKIVGRKQGQGQRKFVDVASATGILAQSLLRFVQ